MATAMFDDDAEMMEETAPEEPAGYTICVRVSRDGLIVYREAVPPAAMEERQTEEEAGMPPSKPKSSHKYECETIEEALKAVLALYRREPLLDRDDEQGEWRSFVEAARAERGVAESR